MPNLIIPPRDLPDAAEVFETDNLVVDNGNTVSKATPVQIVDAGRPLATVQEAAAGVRGDRAMTPLTTAAAIRALGAAAAGSFPTTVNPSVSRPFIQRARDTVSALDLMSAGGLDAAIRNREAGGEDAPAITPLLQEVAFDCARRAWRLDVPAGMFHLDAQIATDRPLDISGAGMDASVLRWSSAAASAGIFVSAGGIIRQTSIKDLGLLINRVGFGTGIALDYSSLIGTNGNIAPRTMSALRVHGCKISGADNGLGTGFLTGISAQSGILMEITGNIINGGPHPRDGCPCC